MSVTPASDLLRSEHRLVETQIDQLLHAVKHPAGDIVSDVRRVLSGIQYLSRPHFQKEENVFYPSLRSQLPELLSQLDEQHEYVREVERHLVGLLESIQGCPDERQRAEIVRFSTELCDVIQHHIVDEEDQLLRLADSTLSREEQVTLAAKMTELEHLICTTGVALEHESIEQAQHEHRVK
ncbi:MAG: hemerythrin domain-containing protein [Acidobacteriia bacterium]|nr:hemerythrin domain-containing protein [Terriglobia bacterium]